MRNRPFNDVIAWQHAMHQLATAMTKSADADERSRGLFILGASSEPSEAVLPLSQLCRESPSARASEMLGCMYAFLGQFQQVHHADYVIVYICLCVCPRNA